MTVSDGANPSSKGGGGAELTRPPLNTQLIMLLGVCK